MEELKQDEQTKAWTGDREEVNKRIEILMSDMVSLVHWIKTQPDRNILRYTSSHIVDLFNEAKK